MPCTLSFYGRYHLCLFWIFSTFIAAFLGLDQEELARKLLISNKQNTLIKLKIKYRVKSPN